jgi:hypothetical protein
MAIDTKPTVLFLCTTLDGLRWRSGSSITLPVIKASPGLAGPVGLVRAARP